MRGVLISLPCKKTFHSISVNWQRLVSTTPVYSGFALVCFSSLLAMPVCVCWGA